MSGHAALLPLTFCTNFQRGEDRNGRVRRGWGQIRFSLPFLLDLSNYSRLVYG